MNRSFQGRVSSPTPAGGLAVLVIGFIFLALSRGCESSYSGASSGSGSGGGSDGGGAGGGPGADLGGLILVIIIIVLIVLLSIYLIKRSEKRAAREAFERQRAADEQRRREEEMNRLKRLQDQAEEAARKRAQEKGKIEEALEECKTLRGAAIRLGVTTRQLRARSKSFGIQIDRFPVAQRSQRYPKIGGNRQCPCGSGKKFKNCCKAHPSLDIA
jgi:hypothetical protein